MKTVARISTSTIALIALIALSATGTVYAQESEPSDGELTAIVVTAQKRAEDLQDVPAAITAISGESLAALEKNTIESISQETPGLSFARAGGQSFIYLRGIGSDIQGSASDPSVALNIDGAYIGRFELGATQFFDLDRVEVLRGPQGTLYGRNATGGVINLISRGPTDQYDLRARASYSSLDRKEFEVATGGPIGGVFGMRIAARFLEDDGFTKDLDPAGSNDIDDQRVFGVRGTIVAAPGDRFEAKLIVDHTDFSGNNTSIRPLDNLGLAETLGAVPTEFGETRNDLDTFDDWDTVGITGQLSYEAGDAITLTSVTAWRDYGQEFEFNTDGTEIDITRTQFRRDYESFSQELRLNYDTPRLRAVVGAFYFHENNLGVLGLPRPSLDPDIAFIIPAKTITDSYAAFVDATFYVTPTIGIIAGIRYSKDEKDDLTQFGRQPGLLGIFDPDLPESFFTIRDAKQSWDAWTPRLGIELTPSTDLLLYATASRGYKAGGMNSYAGTAPFDPEFLWSYEAGIKAELLDRRLRVNGSLFHYDYSDLQVSTFIDGFTLVTNAAEAKVNGVEVETTLLATDGLTLNANVGYLDAEYKDFISPFGLDGMGETNALDVSGNRLRNAPEWKLSGGFNYERPIGDTLRIIAAGQVSHTSRVYFSQFNENVASNGGLTLVDARLGVGADDGRWEVAVFAKNLTDEEYFANVVRFTSTSDPALDTARIGNALGYPAQGRQIGVQASIDF